MIETDTLTYEKYIKYRSNSFKSCYINFFLYILNLNEILGNIR